MKLIRFNNEEMNIREIKNRKKQELSLVNYADYYGTVRYGNYSYIIAKVNDDSQGYGRDRYPHLIDTFIVRPAITEIEANGFGSIFLSQEQTMDGEKIEGYLNSIEVKNKIKNIDDILNVCHWVGRGNKSFEFLTAEDCIFTTTIKQELFETKNDAINSCYSKTFSELQLELENLRKKDSANKNVEVLDINIDESIEEKKVSDKTPKPLMQEQIKPISEWTKEEKVADQAKQILAQIVRTDFINENRYSQKSMDELNMELVALQQDIYRLSDNVALAMVKSCDRVKLDNERKNAYTNTKFEKEPYHRDQYVDLFDYLNSQVSKEAENILLDDDKERELDIEESKKENVVKLAEGLANGTITARAEENLDFKEEFVPMDEATRVKNLSEELKKTDGKQYGYLTKDQVDEIIKKKNSEYSPKTQELLEESQEILNQPELSPDYSVDQNLEGYTKLEQSINENPNLTEKEKQDMRNALWTDFDNYVEHNPEQGKTR